MQHLPKNVIIVVIESAKVKTLSSSIVIFVGNIKCALNAMTILSIKQMNKKSNWT